MRRVLSGCAWCAWTLWGLWKSAPFFSSFLLLHSLSSDWEELATILSVRSFIVASLLRAANSSSSFHLSSEVLFFILLVIFESLLNAFQVLFFLSSPFQFRNTKLYTVPWEFSDHFEYRERKVSHWNVGQSPFHITLDYVCFPKV